MDETLAATRRVTRHCDATYRPPESVMPHYSLLCPPKKVQFTGNDGKGRRTVFDVPGFSRRRWRPYSFFPTASRKSPPAGWLFHAWGSWGLASLQGSRPTTLRVCLPSEAHDRAN